MARVARRTGSQLAMEMLRDLWDRPTTARFRGGVVAAAGATLIVAFATYSAADPSLNSFGGDKTLNALGPGGAVLADLFIQSIGLAAWAAALLMVLFGSARAIEYDPAPGRTDTRGRAAIAIIGLFCLAAVLAGAPRPAVWPLAGGLGGFWGDGLLSGLAAVIGFARIPAARFLSAIIWGVAAIATLAFSLRVTPQGMMSAYGGLLSLFERAPEPEPAPVIKRRAERAAQAKAEAQVSARPDKSAKSPNAIDRPFDAADEEPALEDHDTPDHAIVDERPLAIQAPKVAPRDSGRETRERQKTFDFAKPGGFALPELAMLAKPKPRAASHDEGSLKQNARLLESVLGEFGVKGQIDNIRPGPVVTLYEMVPAPGVKHARVVALSDDIARSMSVAACRVAVVQGRNAIGIELPNARRETVYLRDLLSSPDYERSSQSLPMALGETIGGEPYIADLARMPHLLIAGTTGSGKSVGVNAMILSILYRLSPADCRFIMIDPKMLELSVYDGIPHLLAPVVTDPKKAVVALKWVVREMEDRYRRMSKIGVRNVAGFNERARDLISKGEHFERTVQTGFDDAGRPIYESEKIVPEPMPFLVVVIDEVADLMMVAGKDIEGAVQRLAQMARAAGIHLIMATQRPSVDVITGTIKANFPTRISFQVTSKIDARTILGEQGAEQLLGQGDMLYMAGGGRVTRLHGPFVSDGEVEAVAKYLRDQGEPMYLEEVTSGAEDGDDEGGSVMDITGGGGGNGGGDALYDQAVAVVTREKKASTSYLQRVFRIGYNTAANLMDRLEREGVVSAPNHSGKREVLAPPPPI
jgi:S-DNA-T family DNA segregation ATPase FtsK/SpoIIIE